MKTSTLLATALALAIGGAIGISAATPAIAKGKKKVVHAAPAPAYPGGGYGAPGPYWGPGPYAYSGGTPYCGGWFGPTPCVPLPAKK